MNNILMRYCVIISSLAISALSVPVSGICEAPESKVNPGSLIVPAETWLMEGPKAYYAVYERWPEHWRDVVDAGFITQKLADATDRIYEPDDGKWDFNGDIQYLYQGDNPPLLMTWNEATNTTDSIPVVIRMSTWEEALAVLAESDPQQVAALAGNKDRQRQLSLCSLLENGVGLFWEAYGRLPDSYDELAGSGMGPLAVDTTNPLTGDPYTGDGAPNDIHFECSVIEAVENSGGSFATSIYPVGETGGRLWNGNYLP